MLFPVVMCLSDNTFSEEYEYTLSKILTFDDDDSSLIRLYRPASCLFETLNLIRIISIRWNMHIKMDFK